MLQHACSVSQQRRVQHQPLGPPATSCCGQQHTEGGDVGQEEGHRPCHLPCLFHSCPGLLESRSSPICEAPHRGSAKLGGSAARYHQDFKASSCWLPPSSSPPPLTHTRLHLHSARPQTKLCLLGPPPASAVALAGEVNSLKPTLSYAEVW